MKKIFFRLLFLCCFFSAVFAAWKLWGYYSGYKSGEKEYEDLRDFVTEEGKMRGGEGKADVCPVTVDFDALRKINGQVAGWVYIPGTEINYPVAQGEDNEYYLHHTFEGKENFTGAVFLDCENEPDFTSQNSILYGHNLKTGEMFGWLKRLYDKKFNEEADYRKHPVIWIVTPEYAKEYEIFAAREINVPGDEEAYTMEFASEDQYGEFQNRQKTLSQYDTGVETGPESPMITLSTCTSSTESGRFIVQAVMIQNRKQ